MIRSALSRLPNPVSAARLCLLAALGLAALPSVADAQRRGLFRRLAARRCRTVNAPVPANASQAVAAAPASKKGEWRSLFDGATLDGWKSTEFIGEGKVAVADGNILIEEGEPLTGITYQDKDSLPVTNFEVELEAKRLKGRDFFCGLTFPVEKSYCSFIVSGWSGTVVGLSNLDGYDASENESATYMEFENDRWYRIRVRVTPKYIRAFIDDKMVVDQDIVGRKIDTRLEVFRSQPLGVATFETRAALRNFRLRELTEAEAKAP